MASRGGRGQNDIGGQHGFRRRLMLAVLLLAAAVALARAFQLEVLEAPDWMDQAAEQQAKRMPLPAPRGTIYDRNGVPLAASEDAYRLAIAPREIRDRKALIAKLRTVVGLSAREARAATNPKLKWKVLRGEYETAVREELDGIQGVHFERVQRRFYPHGQLARELLGPVGRDGHALGGIELEYDSILSGAPGSATIRRDNRGRPIPGMMLKMTDPVPGRDVVLTVDVDLQEIAQQALQKALEETKASAGELILANPSTGEILAAVSRHGGRGFNWGGVTIPYEPGSTLKPFAVAALLADHRARLTDSVYAEDGVWRHDGRTIKDTHGYGWLTLADALRYSSNIGIAKMSARLDAPVQYEYLRNFGFGTPTGVSYPSESAGRLRPPTQWSRYSSASLAIGYEIAVTPLQMVLAYGAIANGGLLLEPRLVREIRSRDGRVEHRFPSRVVRRVIPSSVAEQLRSVLVDVVTEGTGKAAALGPFLVAGKTGTARVAARGEGYVSGAYYASFAGFFPADDPQLVFLAKLDRPHGSYYGGTTAAPVAKATLEAVLAIAGGPLDKSAVAAQTSPIPAPPGGLAASLEALSSTGDMSVGTVPPSTSHLVSLTAPGPRSSLPVDSMAVVPPVTGLALRDAVRALHAAGLRVRVEGRGRVRETVPAAHTRLKRDDVVKLLGEEGRQ